MALMVSITASMALSSSGKDSSGRYSGHLDTISVSPSCGRLCQISSVMNGMNGCSSLSVLLITHTST